MVRKHVRIYIEGGAEGRTADSDFRRGWKKFLNEIHQTALANGFQSLEVVRGKGRGNAFRRFKNYIHENPNDLCVLLTDSETEVHEGTTVWTVVSEREGDRWECPDWATENHLFLMVVFVETWLLADIDALQTFFKKDFNPNPLPRTELESRSKVDVERALFQATKKCKNGPYKHGQAHEIIEHVQPERVKTLYHGSRLFDSLNQLIREKAG